MYYWINISGIYFISVLLNKNYTIRNNEIHYFPGTYNYKQFILVFMMKQ